MGTPTLEIRRDAVVQNWRALDARSGTACETAAVVKADCYGLGAAEIAPAFAAAGVRTFFVAVAEEGAALRRILGDGPDIAVFGGHMAGDADLIRDAGLIPMLNSPEQLARHAEALPAAPFGVQLDSGMNRLGIEPADWAALRAGGLSGTPWLAMSHLACADDPEHPQNAAQLASFRAMTDDTGLRRSLAATGGVLMGSDYHFELTRPGIGLYGGAPFSTALQVVTLSIPVIQCRDVAPGESVGYGATWVAARRTRVATMAAGYADGIIRAMSGKALLHADGVTCPLVGRVSMDLLTVDVTDYVAARGADPETLELLGPYQGIDAVADAAGTIGYEILTALGPRYARHIADGPIR
jgi:alanine racemase